MRMHYRLDLLNDTTQPCPIISLEAAAGDPAEVVVYVGCELDACLRAFVMTDPELRLLVKAGALAALDRLLELGPDRAREAWRGQSPDADTVARGATALAVQPGWRVTQHALLSEPGQDTDSWKAVKNTIRVWAGDETPVSTTDYLVSGHAYTNIVSRLTGLTPGQLDTLTRAGWDGQVRVNLTHDRGSVWYWPNRATLPAAGPYTPDDWGLVCGKPPLPPELARPGVETRGA